MNSKPKVTNYGLGIYIHVPFCVKKCGYCDFYSVSDLDKIPIYIQSVVKEMGMAGNVSETVDSIYFGGGTPSLLDPRQIRQLMDAVSHQFDVSPSVEITLEVNPGTVSYEKLSGYRQAGVNRLNIGVQSFSDATLAFLSRIHSADQAIQAIQSSRSAGFDNIGLDLIFGLPGQKTHHWLSDLQAAVDLHPEHLSCYMLTYETGTPLALDLKKSRFKALPEGAVGLLYNAAVEYLADNGLPQYEVSNFSTSKATRSRHNQKYWTHAPYIGFGPSAHSFINNRRSWNVRSVDAYLEELLAGKAPAGGVEDLDRHQLMMETIYLRLRCLDGIDIRVFEKRYDLDFNAMFGSAIIASQNNGFLKISNGRCRLTRRGLLFSDNVAARFINLI